MTVLLHSSRKSQQTLEERRTAGRIDQTKPNHFLPFAQLGDPPTQPGQWQHREHREHPCPVEQLCEDPLPVNQRRKIRFQWSNYVKTLSSETAARKTLFKWNNYVKTLSSGATTRKTLFRWSNYVQTLSSGVVFLSSWFARKETTCFYWRFIQSWITCLYTVPGGFRIKIK